MDFDHLAQLSKLSFTEEEKKEMQKQMQEVIALMDEIQTAVTVTQPARQPSVCYENLRADAAVHCSDGLIEKEKSVMVPKVVG